LIRISSIQVNPELYEIVVEDNGIGIDRDLTKVIFNPFGWMKGGTSREGTGLGLAICHKIVERHGGTIRAESEPGKGAAFILRLPRNQGRGAKKKGGVG
jgi:signal transduction histidine kinase